MLNANPFPHSDPEVLTRFQEELARAAALPGLASAGPVLWPRFAGYYQGLTRLPRKARRALQRRWRRSLGGLALLCALGQAPALAATIIADGTICTLVNAINAANTDTVSGNCPAGSVADTIVLPFASTHSLSAVNNDTDGPNGLPVIISAITVEGNFSTIIRNGIAPEFRILAVGPTGNLALQNAIVSGGATEVGNGGGINNYGTLTLNSSTVSGNSVDYDGGGINNSGTLTLTDSTVSGNSVGLFGAGGINNSGTLTLTDSTVSGNSAFDDGGGINNSGTMNMYASTVSGNTAAYDGGGINSSGTVVVTNSYVESNSAQSRGGGISGYGTLTLTLADSTVSGNTAGTDGGGVWNSYGNTLTLNNSTVTGNTAANRGGGVMNDDSGTVTMIGFSAVEGNSAGSYGGGVLNESGTLSLTDCTVSGNTAGTSGGGVRNENGTLLLTNSTISGNNTGDRGGGVDNSGTAKFTNSTVSGNNATDRGGGVHNTGTATLTDSTASRNAAGRVAGGLFNTGTVTLIQSLLTGNTAPVNGPEAYSIAGQSGPGTVVANGFNVFGHDGSAGIAGFTLGASDFVPADPLAAILDLTLGYNGGATRTHALVFGSPAVDAALGTACATGTDQRGAPRLQDGDGDTFADCDSGAVERGQVPVQAELVTRRVDCFSRTRCRVTVRCNLTEAQCTNPIEVVVRPRRARAADGEPEQTSRRVRFAFGVTNIPPGGTQRVRLRLTRPGRRLAQGSRPRLRGVLGIREIAATVSNTPITISNTSVLIRLRRR